MPSATPSRAFLTPFTVRSYELDGLGHLNHAVFLNYLEQARFETLAASGFPLSELERRRWAVHVVRIEADYRRECRFGDRLVVRTALREMKKSSMVLGQEVLRFDPSARLPIWYPGAGTTADPRGVGTGPVAIDPLGPEGKPAAADAEDRGTEPGSDEPGEPVLALEARIVGVWIGPDGRPMRIPDEIRRALGPAHGAAADREQSGPVRP